MDYTNKIGKQEKVQLYVSSIGPTKMDPLTRLDTLILIPKFLESKTQTQW